MISLAVNLIYGCTSEPYSKEGIIPSEIEPEKDTLVTRYQAHIEERNFEELFTTDKRGARVPKYPFAFSQKGVTFQLVPTTFIDGLNSFSILVRSKEFVNSTIPCTYQFYYREFNGNVDTYDSDSMRPVILEKNLYVLNYSIGEGHPLHKLFFSNKKTIFGIIINFNGDLFSYELKEEEQEYLKFTYQCLFKK